MQCFKAEAKHLMGTFAGKVVALDLLFLSPTLSIKCSRKGKTPGRASKEVVYWLASLLITSRPLALPASEMELM